jgi:hypothetical protein
VRPAHRQRPARGGRRDRARQPAPVTPRGVTTPCLRERCTASP